MTLAHLANRLEKVVTDNSPAILTAIGITGTLTTAYLTGKASFKAAEVLHEASVMKVSASSPEGTVVTRADLKGVLTPQDQIEAVWKLYIPAAGAAVLTIVCMIGSNRIGTRRAAAVAAAYSLTEKAYSDYKDKVIETFGANKEQKVRDELAQELIDKNPVSDSKVVLTGGGDVLCYERWTGQYFLSDMQSLRKAQNDINHQINMNFSASLTDFYDLIGLDPTGMSDEFGWNSDKLLDLQFSATIGQDEKPCIVFDYATVPTRRYNRASG